MDERPDIESEPSAALRRILRDHDAGPLRQLLAEQMIGSDLTTLLLEVMRQRVESVTAGAVLTQYERDRFVRPASVDPVRLVELELLALRTLAALDPPFVPIATSPLAPFGAHASVAGVHQDRVVTTIRRTEVAADPTNSLALEAAVRRRALLARDPRSADVVHLAAVDRVVRAQQFDGPRSFAHFALLGLVSAGRDIGNRRFDATALEHHLAAQIAFVRRVAESGVPIRLIEVRLTDVGGRHGEVLDAVAARVRADDVSVELWPERSAGRDYYPEVCFKLDVRLTQADGASGAVGELVEIGDGGLTGWTRALLGNQKERLMISGLGLERLALLAA